MAAPVGPDSTQQEPQRIITKEVDVSKEIDIKRNKTELDDDDDEEIEVDVWMIFFKLFQYHRQ